MNSLTRSVPDAASLAAFTRVEVLTLIVGATALAALQIPLAGNATVHSKAATCLDNFHRLGIAFQMYATEAEGWFPPNTDSGDTGPGSTWVAGTCGPYGSHTFDFETLANPSRSLLYPYLMSDVTVFRCPANPRVGRPPGWTTSWWPEIVPTARNVSMNAAVGTSTSHPKCKQPVDGPWLDNKHSHFYGQKWLTYGRESDLTLPGPSLTTIFVDEDGASVDNGNYAFGMVTPEWIDWPATWHDSAGTLSFGDGHVELHRWVDPRTPVIGGNIARRAVPGSVDYFWFRDRISALIPK